MEKASKEMLREFVNSQHFTSTSEIMESMKELFSDVLQQVMEAELEEKLGYEKSERLSKNDENSCRKKLPEWILQKESKNSTGRGRGQNSKRSKRRI